MLAALPCALSFLPLKVATKWIVAHQNTNIILYPPNRGDIVWSNNPIMFVITMRIMNPWYTQLLFAIVQRFTQTFYPPLLFEYCPFSSHSLIKMYLLCLYFTTLINLLIKECPLYSPSLIHQSECKNSHTKLKVNWLIFTIFNSKVSTKYDLDLTLLLISLVTPYAPL